MIAIIDESLFHWGTMLESSTNHPLFIFFSSATNECKDIQPIWAQLKEHWSCTTAHFVEINVEQNPKIAKVCLISTTPTFAVFKNRTMVEALRGADAGALSVLMAKHAPSAVTPAHALPPEAEAAKKEGNEAFAEGAYRRAALCYTRALAHAPNSAVLYSNRAFAYIRLVRAESTPKEEGALLRDKALADAHSATTLDKYWPKGWARMGEAMWLKADEQGLQDVIGENREQVRKMNLVGAEQALGKAMRLSGDKKFRADAFAMQKTISLQINGLTRVGPDFAKRFFPREETLA